VLCEHKNPDITDGIGINILCEAPGYLLIQDTFLVSPEHQ